MACRFKSGRAHQFNRKLKMIALGSKSYPYLAVAQHYGISYGEVLAFIEDKNANADTYWKIKALEALQDELYRRKQVSGV